MEKGQGGLFFDDPTDAGVQVGNSSFGIALAGAMDLDGDGLTQIAVGASGTDIDMLDGVGRVYIYEMPRG